MAVQLHDEPRFREGDKVRDHASLGGQVIETWGNGVKVSWNNGHTDWIDERFLKVDQNSQSGSGE